MAHSGLQGTHVNVDVNRFGAYRPAAHEVQPVGDPVQVPQVALQGAHTRAPPVPESYFPAGQEHTPLVRVAPPMHDVQVRDDPEHAAHDVWHGEHTTPTPDSLSYFPTAQPHVPPERTSPRRHEVHVDADPSHVTQASSQGAHCTRAASGSLS